MMDTGGVTGHALEARALPAVPLLVPGKFFAERFQIKSLIREDSMGALYEVGGSAHQQARALRILAPAGQDRTTLLARLRELLAQHESLSAQHICRYLETSADAHASPLWLLSEWQPGCNLERWLRDRGPVPISYAASILGQVATALGEVGAAGIFHGDLRPHNILIGPSSGNPPLRAVHVAGLGLKQTLRGEGDTAQSVHGTPMWLAPEQLSQRGPLMATADVWSFGLLAFRLLTGVVYWRGAQRRPYYPLQLLRELTLEPLEPASLRARQLGSSAILPVGFDEWLARCLTRQPEARFSSVEAAFAALPKEREEQSGAAPPSAGVPVVVPPGAHPATSPQNPEPGPVHRPRRVVLHGFLSAVAFVAIGLGSVGVKRAHHEPTRAGSLAPARAAAAPPLLAPLASSHLALVPTPTAAPPSPAADVLRTPRAEPGCPVVRSPRIVRCGTPEQCHHTAQSLLTQGTPTRAAELLNDACRHGHGESCRKLSELHERGLGVSRSLTAAHRLLGKSCTLGSATACTRYVDDLHQRCMQSEGSACRELAFFLRQHPSPHRQRLSATEYLRLACKHGDARACRDAPSPREPTPPPAVPDRLREPPRRPFAIPARPAAPRLDPEEPVFAI